jgi:hypothetical protein
MSFNVFLKAFADASSVLFLAESFPILFDESGAKKGIPFSETRGIRSHETSSRRNCWILCTGTGTPRADRVLDEMGGVGLEVEVEEDSVNRKNWPICRCVWSLMVLR